MTKVPRVTKGSASSNAWIFDRRATNVTPGGSLADQHMTMSLYPDGSGSISLYTTYRKGKDTKVVRTGYISLTTEDFKVLREAIDCQIARDESLAGSQKQHRSDCDEGNHDRSCPS